MYFSIITVTFNAEENIKKTLDSISMQKFRDFEVIVIDGKSQDKTVNIVEAYYDLINNLSILSEMDDGIYDAMNKGVRQAKGDYIYFLNAGDCFVDCNVLSEVKNFIETYKYGKDEYEKHIFHGNIIKKGKIIKYPPKFYEWKWVYLERAFFSHQAIFASRKLLEMFPFDLSLKICADRDWFIRSIRSGAKYIYMASIAIAVYEGGGVSAGFKQQQADSLIISTKYGGKKAYYIVKIKRKIGELLGHER